MAAYQEARTQIARLLGDVGLREAAPEDIHRVVDAGFATLVEGLLAETSASDDVTDNDSALLFIDDRLHFLSPLLTEAQLHGLEEALRARIASW